MWNKILGFNIWRTVIAIVVLSVLSIWQHIDDIRTVMFIISIYLVLVFFTATFKAIKNAWFTK